MKIEDSENVARAIFSPKMIYEGRLLPAAFTLRPQIQEDYLSVARMSIDSWMEDIMRIPQHKNRTLYGYAEMNVGDIRDIDLPLVSYDVMDCGSPQTPSHAGIFISVSGNPVTGGQHLDALPVGMSEDYLLLAIRNELVALAQEGLQEVVVE